ncbi:MAG: pitrilysin family protein [Oscillospiraceae bacterium]
MSNIKEVKNELLGESYYEIDHSSGLKILVYPKENYSSTYAVFGTKYGSIDNEFKIKGEKDFTIIPEGIAHFLEHKLFESEDLDAFERYAKTGASANAYTSFDKTCYLFSCSDNFKESLEILLDFVTHPYFTKETVEKEQGIIGQEIKMCQDEPSWETLFSLLRAMYKVHPVRIDIAGTVNSISEITAEMLYKCYNTFYNLNNMVLCVAGNVTTDEVLTVCDKILKKAEPIEIERRFHNEPVDVVKKYTEENLSVASPIFSLGFKETMKTPEISLKDSLCSNIILDVVAGKTTDIYNDMLEEGLINTSFDYEFFDGYGYACALFSGETNNAEEVSKRIIQRIEDLKKNGIEKADFERVRRKIYGRTIMAFNDIDGIANALVPSFFLGETLFDDMNILSELTLEDVEKRLKNSIDTSCSSLSVIKPA